MNYDVGDLVKDNHNRIYIVISLNHNRDNIVYNVSLSQVAGKPIPAFQYDTKGHIRMFPTDVSRI
jgi:hypothetical protein